MDFAADFTAIDFETASRRADSACQLGAVRFRGGKPVDSAVWLIRPQPLYFSPMNIRIHGIRPDDVSDQPVFGELWPEFWQRFGNDCLVAHNASFDMGVLLACLQKSRCEIPDLDFTCTRAIARRTWPERPRFGLKPLSQWLGVEFRHHDALEDARACAKILLAAGIARQAVSLDDLESRLGLSRGRAGDWGMQGPMRAAGGRRKPWSSPRSKKNQAAPWQPTSSSVAERKAPYAIAPADSDDSALDIQRLLVRADFIRPLKGQRVVIAGRLQRISQCDAEQLAVRLGGHCEATVTDETTLLVVAKKTAGGCESIAADDLSSRHQVQSRQRNGQAIRIVDEEEFLSLVIARQP